MLSDPLLNLRLIPSATSY